MVGEDQEETGPTDEENDSEIASVWASVRSPEKR